MSLAPERLAIGITRHFTSSGVRPYDQVQWERRDARISNWKDGTVAFEQLGVEFPVGWSLNATNIVAQKYFRGTLGHAAARVVAASGHRPGRRHHLDVGRRGWLLRQPARGRGVQRRVEVHPRHAAGRVQQPGVVQHRRQGRAAAGQRLLHPGRRRHDGRHPQLVPRRGHDLQGRVRFGHQPVEHPLQLRAAQRRRHRQRSGQLHARRRCIGRHDQERWQDAPCRQDGHPQRRSPRHRRVRVVQGEGRAQGSRAARRRLRHGPRRRRQLQHPVPERQQLGASQRRVHAGRHRRRRVEPVRSEGRFGRPHRASPRPVARVGNGIVGMRRSRLAVRHHDQQVAHRPRDGPHQRLQPVQRVHAPRQLGVQPGVDQPAALPRRGRQLRRRGIHAHDRGHLHRAGDPGRPRRLPDREDRRDQPQLPSAGHRLRQPRRAC